MGVVLGAAVGSGCGIEDDAHGQWKRSGVCALECLASLSCPLSARLRAVKLCLWILMPTAGWVAGKAGSLPRIDMQLVLSLRCKQMMQCCCCCWGSLQCHAHVLLRVLVAASASLWDSIAAGSQLHGPEVRIGLQGADKGQVMVQWEARQMALLLLQCNSGCLA